MLQVARNLMSGVGRAVFLFAAAGVSLAQDVISAKAGLVYFVQGSVWVAGGEKLGPGVVNRQLREGEIVFSEAGRAEVLLNPGTVLRIGEMTRIRMDNANLTDTRVSIEGGSAVLTVNQALKFDRVRVQIGGAVVAIQGAGVYRFDSARAEASGLDPGARIRVFSGQAVASYDNNPSKTTARRGQAVRLPSFAISKFDVNDTDGLQQWAEKRGTPPPAGIIPPMKCFSEPSKMAELKDWIKDCLRTMSGSSGRGIIE